MMLRRREFIGTTATHRPGWVMPVRVVAGFIATISLLAIASNWGPVGITASRLRASIAPEFNNITLLQQHLFGRTVPAGAQLDVAVRSRRRPSRMT
jgi:hypothetical protein